MTLPSLLCENAAQGFTEAAEAHLARVSKATNEPDDIVCDLATTSGLPAPPASSGAQSDSVAEGVLADVMPEQLAEQAAQYPATDTSTVASRRDSAREPRSEMHDATEPPQNAPGASGRRHFLGSGVGREATERLMHREPTTDAPEILQHGESGDISFFEMTNSPDLPVENPEECMAIDPPPRTRRPAGARRLCPDRQNFLWGVTLAIDPC